MPVTWVTTRETVGELMRLGFNQTEIADALERSKSTIAYHARNLGRPPDERFNRRYDWSAVQHFYDEGHTVRECAAHFGFSRETWHSAVKRGALVSRPRSMPIHELLKGRHQRTHLKRRLIEASLLEPICAECGIAEWRGAALSLELHHANGIGDDNRLENLSLLLCPNCHSQTENWGSRNRRATAAGRTANPPPA